MLGGPAEYPGHPLVLATMVMDRYASFEHAASNEPGAGYYNAICDSFIPGAGCAVSSTMSVLKIALGDDPGSVDLAVEEAGRYWDGWERQSPANKDRAAHGRTQAEGIKSAFLLRLAAWKSGVPTPSKYRRSAAVTI